MCRASLNGASTCRRCRADLQKVQEIEQRGQALAGAAMLGLAEGDGRCRTMARSRAAGSRLADSAGFEKTDGGPADAE